MWTSNRGHIFRVDGIQCHNIGVFSNVVMQKKRIVSRKTSDWPNSYCSVYERCQQRYLVYYEIYRDDILQRRILGADASSYEI